MIDDELAQDLADLRAAKDTTPPEAVIALLEKHGFQLRRDRESTRTYVHSVRRLRPIPVPYESPLLPGEVKRIANAIEEVMSDDA
jgi:predicted RNA binding protein YcfA (HicA-like mRNA interferase family)